MSPDEKLLYMVNQIVRNFATQDEEVAAQSTADHIAKYWDPRMKLRIAELAADDGADLSLAARQAIEIISAHTTV